MDKTIRPVPIAGLIALPALLTAVCVASALAQDSEPATAPPDVCASNPVPERNGLHHEPTDRLDMVATALEAIETAKALLLDPRALQGAQWCLEEDDAARARSMKHWRNIAAGDAGAVVDRFSNLKGNTTIYLVRVAKDRSLIRSEDGTARFESNYAAVHDQPDRLVVLGYFAGRPGIDEIMANLTMRAQITKNDGKSKIFVGDDAH
jgi:hypothetical protein